MKWGIIGPGAIAQQFAAALKFSERGELYAVASRNLQRAGEFACRFGATISYGDYESLIGDDQVDAIYIATPHSHHFHYAALCLQANKHLLLEKPLTVNAAQTEYLVALAEQHQCVLQEALWSRFMPCFAQVKQWMANDIGQVQYISSQIGFAFSHLRNHRITSPALAGGALLDLGVYSISISQYLLAEYPSQIQALGLLNNDQVDQNTLVNLSYPSGVTSQFVCTIGAQSSNVMTIHGKQGYIQIPRYFWNGEQAQLFQDDKLVETIDFPHPTNGFEYQIESVMDSVEQGRLCDPRMNHQDSINVMKTLDEVRRQIGLQFPIEIESLN
ncbi:Gfo/Idh/MocA family oxidoreductase [Aliiglaciecola litoralis]|uniref:Gfo/Idh/MocA family oxidoreductase n=1 Tax=Aliiglaciecola litoralis TaxID=582857 RepID=A0ABN1LM88_9ALTE